MIKIPEHVNKLITYKPGKPIQELRRDYGLEKIVKLGSNENPLGPSPKAKEAINDSFKDLEFYPEPACIDIRKKFANKFGNQFNIKIENVIVGNGSEGIINYIFKAFFQPGDELLTCQGSFIGVYVLAQAYNVPCHKLPLTKDYKFDLDNIIKNIDKKTKAIYLANPNNPTGTIFTKPDFEEFMSKVPSDIIVILDEAYYEFAVDLTDEYPIGINYDYDNLISLRTFSKAYGIAGIRIGYGFAKSNIIEALLKVKLPFEPSISAQAAGMGAIDDDEFLKKTLDNNKKGLEYYYTELEKLSLKYFKSYANFVMIEFDTAEEVNQLNSELLKRGVIVRPLTAFGLPNCLRISIGTEEENKICMKNIRELLIK